jgi:hypothetical protein
MQKKATSRERVGNRFTRDVLRTTAGKAAASSPLYR